MGKPTNPETGAESPVGYALEGDIILSDARAALAALAPFRAPVEVQLLPLYVAGLSAGGAMAAIMGMI